jgi:hypothetical protein
MREEIEGQGWPPYAAAASGDGGFDGKMLEKM